MALKVTRWTSLGSAFLLRSTSWTCQLIASPSRSGSVARIKVSAFLASSVIALSCFARSGETCHSMSKPCSGSTEPSFGGRSRTWPKEASTRCPLPRYFSIVFAFAGDSTTTSFKVSAFLYVRTRDGGDPRRCSSSHPRADPVARVPIEPAREIQFEERHLHRAGRRARQADELVDRHRRRPEQRLDRPEHVRAVERLVRRTFERRRGRAQVRFG